MVAATGRETLNDVPGTTHVHQRQASPPPMEAQDGEALRPFENTTKVSVPSYILRAIEL